MSKNFLDVSALRDALVAIEIVKAESGEHGVHGLINLLKTIFRWEWGET